MSPTKFIISFKLATLSYTQRTFHTKNMIIHSLTRTIVCNIIIYKLLNEDLCVYLYK